MVNLHDFLRRSSEDSVTTLATPESLEFDFGEPVRLHEPICVAIIGLGSLGEALLSQFGQTYHSIGFDLSEKRIHYLREKYQPWKKVTLTADESMLDSATHYLISVPAGTKSGNVNMGHVQAAVDMVLHHARPGCSVVITRTVPVGTTRAMLGPYQHILHCGMGKLAGNDKVFSALTPPSLLRFEQFYSRVYDNATAVDEVDVAKRFPNIHHDVQPLPLPPSSRSFTFRSSELDYQFHKIRQLQMRRGTSRYGST